jgi:uncharacterized protein Yka (UPF0111/DUF47 family)
VPYRWSALRRVDTTYYTLFRRSGELAVVAADALHELFRGGTIDEASFAPLDDAEHRADSNTHDILNRLERGHRPPFPEAETRRLILEIDDIVDQAETAGELALLTGVGQVTPVAVEMTELLTRIARETASLLTYLEAGDGYRPYVVRIHELENEGDTLWMRAKRDLFRTATDPIDVLRWNEIYAALEAAIDSCESSARLIERAIGRTRA